MDKKEIATFFDERAAFWDSELIRDDDIIALILDKGDVEKGKSVLDVACGTGVLFGDYIGRGVESITGIDFSAGMLEKAKIKYPSVKLICADAETYAFDGKYDCIMIYNAFPHFTTPDVLFDNLSRALNENGRLTVAHGMSREALEKCHSGAAEKVSLPLPDTEKLAELMSPYLNVDAMISDSRMYMVSGTKR